MRSMLLLFLALFAASTSTAQVTGSCAPELVGSPSCPYQWVGATSVAFTGDGNGLGLVGMTTQCRADFGPGSRMCKSEEVMDSDTLNPNSIPAVGCWLRPSWRPVASSQATIDGLALDETGMARIPSDMSCIGWTIGGGGVITDVRGLILGPPNRNNLGACTQARPVACCKPIAVGEPQASMMLPTGVGMLAMLSMMKGDA
jgi:hypothetical protein